MTASALKQVTDKRYRVEPSLDDLKKEMASFAIELKKDPKAARQFLRDAGILTSKGTLKKAYRG